MSDRGRSPARRQTPAPAAPTASNSSGSGEEDYGPPVPVSRRPSLGDPVDPSGALALVLCGPPPPRPTTILRHECFLHQSAALVHHHQCRVHDLSGSEDDETDPGYASGNCRRKESSDITVIYNCHERICLYSAFLINAILKRIIWHDLLLIPSVFMFKCGWESHQ